MNLMQLIKLVLDEAYEDIPGDEAAKDKRVRTALDMLAPAYADLKNEKRVPIDYSSPDARFAYIYKYTVAHADYIRLLIQRSKELSSLFEGEAVSVACVGGGPGSDLLGVLKHMMLSNSSTTLTCYLFDRERAWGDSWSEVAKPLKADFKLYPVFQQMDITDESQWISYRKFLKADLFTFSYFLSEVWSFRANAEPFFKHCLNDAKSGSYFLFIDNNDANGEFAAWFDELAAKCGVQLVDSGIREMTFSIHEEKTDLEPYFSKFDWLKRKSNVAFRIGRKQ